MNLQETEQLRAWIEAGRKLPISWIAPLLEHISTIYLDEEHSSIAAEQENAPLAFMPIDQYQGKEKRLRGFTEVYAENRIAGQLADTLPLYGPELRYLNPEYFDKWLENDGQLPPEYIERIRKEAHDMRTHALNSSLAVRRSYYVDKESIADGPTHNDLRTDEQVVQSIVGPSGFFQFAKNRGYHLKEGSEITVFLQEWIDPLQIEAAQGQIDKMPAGGNAYVEGINADGSLNIIIKGCLGENSGPDKGHPEVDEYRVLYELPSKEFPIGRPSIKKSHIVPQRTIAWLQRYEPPDRMLHAIDTTPKAGLSDSHIYEVPIDSSSAVGQPLFEIADLLRVSYVVGLTYVNTGKTHKVEFTKGTFRAKSGKGTVSSVAILEAVPFEVPERNGKEVVLSQGRLRAILNDETDIDSLQLHLNEFEEDNPLVFLSHDLTKIFTARQDILEKLKNIGRKLTIVGYLSATEHKTNELRIAHTVYHIEPTDLREGRKYFIKQKGAIIWLDVYLGKAEKRKQISSIVNLKSTIAMGINKPAKIGGKAVGLAGLYEHKFTTPPSLILTSSFFFKIINNYGLGDLFQKLQSTTKKEELQTIFSKIYSTLKTVKISDYTLRLIRDAIRAEFDPNGEFTGMVAIRSNASYEDHKGMPLAGRLISKLNINSQNIKELNEAILQVMCSYFDPKRGTADAIFEGSVRRELNSILRQLSGPVLIQPMLTNVYASGTLFGKETDGAKRENVIVIEATGGTSGIVDGDKSKPYLTVKYDVDLEVIEGISYWDGQKSVDVNPSVLNENINIYFLKYKEIMDLVRLAEIQARKLNNAQDAEWAIVVDPITQTRKVVFLQSRPI